MVTVKVLAVVASKNWPIFQMNVHNAFLQGDLLEDVYTIIPQGFCSQRKSGKICKLHKSLYGLKQAARQWYLKLTTTLLQLEFVRSHYDFTFHKK